MTYQIDQSGKIEATNKNTVLGMSNGSSDAVLIKARTKRQLQEIFRRNGQIRNYILFVFAAGLSLLIKHNRKVSNITVDLEYYGKEAIIKKILLQMLSSNKNLPAISFGKIGKRSNAHHLAHDIATGEIKTKRILKLTEILNEIKKTEVGNRLKDA